MHYYTQIPIMASSWLKTWLKSAPSHLSITQKNFHCILPIEESNQARSWFCKYLCITAWMATVFDTGFPNYLPCTPKSLGAIKNPCEFFGFISSRKVVLNLHVWRPIESRTIRAFKYHNCLSTFKVPLLSCTFKVLLQGLLLTGSSIILILNEDYKSGMHRPQ